MAIEIKDIEHLAGLARIAVSDSEKEVLKHDLEEILAYVSEIKEVAESADSRLGAAEMGTPEASELRNVMRADEGAHEPGVFTESILAAAPQREGNRILVKKIL